MNSGLARSSPRQAVLIAVLGVALIGIADYVTGYEIAMSLFYVGPVAIAAWYGGRTAAIGIALIACVSWYVADQAAGHPYSHPAIPVWNSLVRLGFFLISGGLLAALHSALSREQQRVRTDALTGLMSRRGFEERLEHDLALAQRSRGPITVAYVDLDDFKAVNDARGHAAGDRVLQVVGRAIGGVLRRVDTGARLGGDEFGLILPDTDEAGAREVVARIDADLRQALVEASVAVTCSIGVVTLIGPAQSVAEVVAKADALMYDVKRRGKAAVGYEVVGE